MHKEIEDLFKLYAHKDDYQERIAAAAAEEPFPDIAEALNLRDKIDFGKDRQRAEMLKQNSIFLKELSRIKEELGEGFFRLIEQAIPEPGLGNPDKISSIGPRKFNNLCRDLVLTSDFAEPVVIIEKEFIDVNGHPFPVYYLPGTPIFGDGWPEREVGTGPDPFPPGWVILKSFDPDCDKIGTPEFAAKCKEELFARYIGKWGDFLENWHISLNWNGDLQYLHVHALPSVIVEIDKRSHNLPVVIRLGAWAAREDVGAAWPIVEEKMKEARVYRERENDNFLRDQIWYKQSKDLSMPPSAIALEWAKRFPKEVDLEVIEKLTRDEQTFMDVPPQEILEEVLKDDRLAELKGRFIEARKAYISTSLRDRVKKSIKATEKKIMRLGSDDWDRNRERLLKPVPIKREK
ncbi:MAG: hypothetical protein MIO92_03480 [Methanosarcinaceae archaeon]|nr:hypothetical protein [Methanosarcinaceae archaeon]TFG92568.1 MAG: hypothetical protein E4H15_03425 [Syntrophobacterales bacterium]